MADSTELALLKTDLGLTGTLPAELASFLQQKLDAAETAIENMGIVLNGTDKGDIDLHVMYAAWLYRKRITNDPMPAMLRHAINDRKLQPPAPEAQEGDA